MDINSATIFLVGSILISLGVMVLITAAVFVNVLLHKYWKPIKFYAYHAPPQEIKLEKTEEEIKKK